MRARLAEFYELARSSFWFLPTIMMAVGLLLFALTLSLDEADLGSRGWLHTMFYSGGTTNAVNLLQTITAAMVAIATVVFSTLMLVLTLATSQFGHRLIRSFMRDRANQAVLGIFLATFVYCMLVFHMVGNDPKNHFVPGISVSVGFVLAIFATCTLIYFTHHMAQLIAAPEVLETVAVELDAAIDRMYPQGKDNAQDAEPPPNPGAADYSIAAASGGYVQEVGLKALRQLAVEQEIVIVSRAGYGDYLLAGNVLAEIHGPELDDQTRKQIVRQYVLGDSRLADHDLLFATNQLAEIGVRALSPALNNPFTALDCINRIGASLARLMARPLPAQALHDDHGNLRVIFPIPDFHHLLDAAFMPIRNYGRASVITVREMLRVIEKLAPLTRREFERQALVQHAMAIREAADHGLRERIDIERIQACFEDVEAALEGHPG